jgi:hypothetical protein
MSDMNTRWATIVVAQHLDEQHLERHRDIDYVARVISNTQGREMTPNGRNYEFGRTNNEVEFYEADSEEHARKIANRFDELWENSHIRQRLSVLARTVR